MVDWAISSWNWKFFEVVDKIASPWHWGKFFQLILWIRICILSSRSLMNINCTAYSPTLRYDKQMWNQPPYLYFLVIFNSTCLDIWIVIFQKMYDLFLLSFEVYRHLEFSPFNPQICLSFLLCIAIQTLTFLFELLI